LQRAADVNHLATYSREYHGESFNGAAPAPSFRDRADSDQFDLADYLISAGANVNATTGEGYSLIDYFRRQNDASAVAYLAAKGPKRQQKRDRHFCSAPSAKGQ